MKRLLIAIATCATYGASAAIAIGIITLGITANIQAALRTTAATFGIALLIALLITALDGD